MLGRPKEAGVTRRRRRIEKEKEEEEWGAAHPQGPSGTIPEPWSQEPRLGKVRHTHRTVFSAPLLKHRGLKKAPSLPGIAGKCPQVGGPTGTGLRLLTPGQSCWERRGALENGLRDG